MMSLPRVLNLDKDGTLRMQILPQATTLRSNTLTPAMDNKSTVLTLNRANGELQCDGVKGRAFEIAIGYGETKLVHVSYQPERHVLLVDDQEIPLQQSDKPSIHGFVDGSVVELILGERIGYTKRFYYDEKTAPDIKIRVSGEAATANAWNIKPISGDRLTTPAHA